MYEAKINPELLCFYKVQHLFLRYKFSSNQNLKFLKYFNFQILLIIKKGLKIY